MQKGRLLAPATVLLLGGYATSDGNTHYQLPFEPARNVTIFATVGASGTTSGASSAADVQGAAVTPFHADSRVGRRQLWVAQVPAADLLAVNKPVYQTSDKQYITASSNLQVSPLKQQLQ